MSSLHPPPRLFLYKDQLAMLFSLDSKFLQQMKRFAAGEVSKQLVEKFAENPRKSIAKQETS